MTLGRAGGAGLRKCPQKSGPSSNQIFDPNLAQKWTRFGPFLANLAKNGLLCGKAALFHKASQFWPKLAEISAGSSARSQQTKLLRGILFAPPGGQNLAGHLSFWPLRASRCAILSHFSTSRGSKGPDRYVSCEALAGPESHRYRVSRGHVSFDPFGDQKPARQSLAVCQEPCRLALVLKFLR